MAAAAAASSTVSSSSTMRLGSVATPLTLEDVGASSFSAACRKVPVQLNRVFTGFLSVLLILH